MIATDRGVLVTAGKFRRGKPVEFFIIEKNPYITRIHPARTMNPAASPAAPAILLVKTSSMGDVVHLLPAVSDIAGHLPQATIDWAVEESLAALPALHPAIANVIPLAIRRWRRAPLAAATRREFASFRSRLQERSYDIVIDAQGLVKSAWIASMAKGELAGPAFGCAREPLAALFYRRRLQVPWRLPAIVANRRLASLALGIPDASGSPPDYGIRAATPAGDWVPSSPYAVLLHSASATSKLWPEACWNELGAFLAGQGLHCVLPWGSDAERQRAVRLAEKLGNALVPRALSLAEAASLLSGARLAVGVDSGLTHLAAAVGTPSIALFSGSDPERTGLVAMSGRFAVNLGCANHPPSPASAIEAAIRALS
jgi:heptosyltransferase-1